MREAADVARDDFSVDFWYLRCHDIYSLKSRILLSLAGLNPSKVHRLFFGVIIMLLDLTR